MEDKFLDYDSPRRVYLKEIEEKGAKASSLGGDWHAGKTPCPLDALACDLFYVVTGTVAQ